MNMRDDSLRPRPSRQVPALGGQPMPMPHRPQAGASSGGGLTPKDFLQILRKRKWLVLACLLFFTGVAVVTTILWAKYAPMFTATAYMEVRPSQRQLGFEMPSIEGTAYGIEERLRTHAELITAEPVLARAVVNDDVRQTTWFQREPGTATHRLREDLSVVPLRDTSLIKVSVTTYDPIIAATLATAVGTADQEDTEVATKRQFDKHLKDLQDEREDLETNINRLNDALSSAAGSSATQEQHSKWGVLVSELTRQQLTLSGQIRAAENSYRRLLELQEQQALGEAPEVLAILNDNPSYIQLLRQKSQTVAELQYLLTQYQETHPKVVEANQRYRMIEQELLVLVAQAAERVVLDTQRMRLELAAAQEMVVNESEMAVRELRRIEANMTQQSNRRLRLQELNRELARVTQSIAQTRLTQNREQPVYLRQAAQAPEKRSQPKWSIMMPSGVLLGLLVGLGLALLLEAVDTSIKRPSDIRRRVDLPLLGIIPYAGDLEETIDDLYLGLQTHPDSPFGEAFRQIRTRLVFSGPVSEQRSLLITSPSPEDGRTVVAINLSIAIAQAGSRVLLVDANFRQPKIDTVFPGCPADGLTNALVDQGDWRELVHEVNANLAVMSSGPLPPNPAELLGSSHMRRLIEEMSELYDRVLFDSGPCIVVSDPVILSSLTEAVILNLRAGVNSQGIAQRARNTIQDAGGRILGVTLNGVRVMPGGYLRKSYETFYEYRERQSLPA